MEDNVESVEVIDGHLTNNDTRPAPMEKEAMKVLSAYVCSYLRQETTRGGQGTKDKGQRGCRRKGFKSV